MDVEEFAAHVGPTCHFGDAGKPGALMFVVFEPLKLRDTVLSRDQAQRVHAIPMKKTDQGLIDYLTLEEMRALLDAPDPQTVSGARDRAMLHLTFAAGLRVSELDGAIEFPALDWYPSRQACNRKRRSPPSRSSHG